MKNKFMQTALPIGLLIGVGLFSLILFFINKFRTNDGTAKVDDYINNCIKIELMISNKPDLPELGNVTGFFTRRGSLDYSTIALPFYSVAYKKYFKIEFIGKQQDADGCGSWLMDIRNGDKIEATVNKIELADTTYGTQKNPMLIFKFKCHIQDYGRLDYPYCLNDFAGDSVSTVQKNTEKMYRNMISVYLTFVKSKKDFKKMFPR